MRTIATRADRLSSRAAKVKEQLKKALGKKPAIHWFTRAIRREDTVAGASLKGQSAAEMPGRKQVKTHYRHLAKEILEQMGDR